MRNTNIAPRTPSLSGNDRGHIQSNAAARPQGTTTEFSRQPNNVPSTPVHAFSTTTSLANQTTTNDNISQPLLTNRAPQWIRSQLANSEEGLNRNRSTNETDSEGLRPQRNPLFRRFGENLFRSHHRIQSQRQTAPRDFASDGPLQITPRGRHLTQLINLRSAIRIRDNPRPRVNSTETSESTINREALLQIISQHIDHTENIVTIAQPIHPRPQTTHGEFPAEIPLVNCVESTCSSYPPLNEYTRAHAFNENDIEEVD